MPHIEFVAAPRLPRDLLHLDYQRGMVVELPPDQCERWIRRGVAVYVGAPVATPAPPPALEPALEPRGVAIDDERGESESVGAAGSGVGSSQSTEADTVSGAAGDRPRRGRPPRTRQADDQA